MNAAHAPSATDGTAHAIGLSNVIENGNRMLEPSTGVSPAAFPIVGVGASAGGLEAFGELLRCVPPNADLAFVLVQHLDRTHSSLLSDVLQKSTTMPVSEAEHGQRVESGHVYVITPNTELALA